MDMEFQTSGGYSVNLKQVVNDTTMDIMAITKLTASRLMNDGYMIVGDFIKGISDTDLQALIDESEPGSPNQMQDLILLAEMLATGEGGEYSQDFDGFSTRANNLLTFLVMESLHRKGLVKVIHENLSFNEDMGDKIVIERIDGLDYSQFKGE